MTPYFSRQICADNTTLRRYLKGRFPDLDDIRRNLFLKERSLNMTRPDHWYKNHMKRSIGRAKDMNDLLLIAFEEAVGTIIEDCNGCLVIQAGQLGNYQDLVTRIPPLVLTAFAIFRHNAWPAYDMEAIGQFVDQFIAPNIRNTTLLSPFYPRLASLIRGEGGLSDLHIHLNGTTEFDHVWLDALARPLLFYESLAPGLNHDRVKEQYEQIEPGLTPYQCFQRVRLAAALRYRISAWLYAGTHLTRGDLAHMAGTDLIELPALFNSESHPVHEFLGSVDWSSETAEALMYIHVFRFISRGAPDTFTRMFHLYLLLYGFLNQFLVQQVEQNGFDQFQKIADNEARASAEKTYKKRFCQLSGKTGKDARLIEGRFAPKKTAGKTLGLLNQITRGFAAFQEDKTFHLTRDSHINENKPPKLKLVAHFIKKADHSRSGSLMVRHQTLRKDLMVQARALAAARQHSPYLRQHLVGADAAANELHAPPEVFAPVFRFLQRQGLSNFTFHVGEDFLHLLSGIRAVHECLTFLNLKNGNRIGHGTALGIDPKFWQDEMAGDMTVTQGEWLDNLLFLYGRLLDNHRAWPGLEALRAEIERLGADIYKDLHASPMDLLNAYQMRYLDPLKLFTNDQDRLDSLDVTEWTEWDMADREKALNRIGFKLFRSYHTDHRIRQHYQKPIPIKVGKHELVNSPILKKLQQWGIDDLNRRDVVIESMPTSNLRISFYRTHKDHHLWRWLGVGKNAFTTNPGVCLGSDDPGIFATHIQNEYAHVYEQLVYHQGVSGDDAQMEITRLARNANTYGFQV